MMLKLKGITKHFPPNLYALNAVDLEIECGEFVAISGRSGSGKSTLLNIMGLLDTPTNGELWISNQEAVRLSDGKRAQLRRTLIGFVFQRFNLLPGLSVVQNVELPALYAGTDARRARTRAMELLETVGLTHRAAAYPRTLSGGESQRVAVCRALCNEPPLLIADEPTGSLDSENAEAVVKMLQEINRNGRTVVLVTHDPGVAALAPRRIDVRDGIIVSDVNTKWDPFADSERIVPLFPRRTSANE